MPNTDTCIPQVLLTPQHSLAKQQFLTSQPKPIPFLSFLSLCVSFLPMESSIPALLIHVLPTLSSINKRRRAQEFCCQVGEETSISSYCAQMRAGPSSEKRKEKKLRICDVVAHLSLGIVIGAKFVASNCVSFLSSDS